MKGWLFTKALEPTKLIEKEDPKVVPGEVIVDIKACGLCHSDVICSLSIIVQRYHKTKTGLYLH